MTPRRQIRADFDRQTLTIYQAYPDAIADPSLKAGRLVPPFSFRRMTWIKPSFLWLMGRSNWGKKRGQERTLAIRITREGWLTALREGVLTSYEPGVHRSFGRWEDAFEAAKVHVQWDPERSLRGAGLAHDSIQVGISRHRIRTFVEEWIVGIEDLTPTVDKIRRLRDAGRVSAARRLLPPEKVFPVSEAIMDRLGME